MRELRRVGRSARGGRRLRALGVDPGSRATGFGVIEVRGSGLLCLASGVIRPTETDLAGRLAKIHAGLDALIAKWCPDTIGLEAVFSARSARSALVLGQARGAALAACARTGLPIAEYAPTQVKMAVVGQGQAAKAQVQHMVQVLLGLARPPAQDAADALAIAICHVRRAETEARLARAAHAGATPPARPRRSAPRKSSERGPL